ncbi:NAD(P)-dependent oxidoreductase [Phytoactinopolyspora alkaliphila]|uniref:NAD(P)-dependent oxidoreductase n=1 Tax=Phytoactinopolyspora alkaliphila TaxID=1783498 RepID=A0A6N9YK00_9ACTN|nr:NAD(P)-dependent oxidoreductase [Phytoactinopolyspora alkaliphila]NED95209.1 NAD(P)-dependent oxidoreductase [Phytoactinopolyspora alkaliphila]
MSSPASLPYENTAHENSPQGVAGILGLGDMGAGMAQNLVGAGYEIVAFDPSPAASQAAAEIGIRMVTSPAEVAAAATSAVICVVRTEDQANSALLGADGVARGAKAGLPVLIASTLSPSATSTIGAQLEEAGLRPLSAALSGGPWGSRAGTLTFMVSGHPSAVMAVEPLLDAMGSRTYVVSERLEAAQAAKLGVQLIYGVNMFGIFEALRLGAAFDLDQAQLTEIFTHSVGDSWVARNWDHVRDWWEGDGNGLDILVKDMRATLAEADHMALSLPVTHLSFDLMRSVWPAFGHTMPPPGAEIEDPVPWA